MFSLFVDFSTAETFRMPLASTSNVTCGGERISVDKKIATPFLALFYPPSVRHPLEPSRVGHLLSISFVILRFRSLFRVRQPAFGCLSEQSDNSNRSPSDSVRQRATGRKGTPRHENRRPLTLLLSFEPTYTSSPEDSSFLLSLLLSPPLFLSRAFFITRLVSRYSPSRAYCFAGLFSYLRRRSSETFISSLSPGGSLF